MFYSSLKLIQGARSVPPYYSLPKSRSVAANLANIVASVNATHFSLTGDTNFDLSSGVFGFEYGIGISSGYVFALNIAGAATNQSIAETRALLGIDPNSIVNVRPYFNLDPFDDYSTRVYGADISPFVESASLSGTATSGEILTGTHGVIIGSITQNVSVQWLHAEGGAYANIGGATSNTFTLTDTQIGSTIKFIVTSTNGAGSNSANSGVTSAVAVAGDQYFANVVLLAINESAANGTTTFVDQSIFGRVITTVGNTVWSNTSPPSGLTSTALFDGTGDRLTVANAPELQLGNNNFTIEVSCRPDIGGVILAKTDTTGTAREWAIRFVHGSGIYFNASNDGTNNFIFDGIAEFTPSWTPGNDYTVAVVRNGTSWAGYLNGTRVWTITDGTAISTQTTLLTIGDRDGGGLGVTGRVWSAIITNGVARYTGASYVLPTLPRIHAIRDSMLSSTYINMIGTRQHMAIDTFVNESIG